MKAIVLALWLFTTSLGSLISLVLLSHNHVFDRQSYEIFFLAGVMFVFVLIFGILAYFYKSSNVSENDQGKQ